MGNFHSKVNMTLESEIRRKNQLDSSTRTHSKTIGGGGLEWGAWLEFIGDDATITKSSLAFLADIFVSLPMLLPRSERVGLTTRLVLGEQPMLCMR